MMASELGNILIHRAEFIDLGSFVHGKARTIIKYIDPLAQCEGNHGPYK